MLDQSFSSKNFNVLFLKENKRGNFNKSYFTKEYFDKHNEFKTILMEKYALKKSNGKLTPEELNCFSEKLELINQEKEEIRLKIFDDISKTILDKKFQFSIEFNPIKGVFTVEKDAPSFFAIKQLQRNLNETFNIKQASRNNIIKQLYGIIADGYPKIVVKTDIKSFYESIPQNKLFEKIDDNTLLSPFSKKLIRKLFYEYENKKDKTIILPNKGVPRGIGVSAYLSELYMREIDTNIKAIDDIIFFARYVDDIVVVFAPKTESTKRDYLDEVKKIICSDNALSLKDGSDGEKSKTAVINLPSKSVYNEAFSFLGYKFNMTSTSKSFKLILEISDNKFKKYTTRITKSIEAYNNDSRYNEKEARSLLFSRLKFLTGNFHLNSNKRNVKSGVYYSNEMLKLNIEKYESLKRLDMELLKAAHKISLPPKIGIKKINQVEHIKNNFSFQKGFNEREKYFYTFNFSEKEAILYSKKFKRTVNKFEVIKSIWE